MRKIINHYKKNENEKVQIMLFDENDQLFVDVRVHQLTPRHNWKPNKNGLTLPIHCLSGLVRGLMEADTFAMDQITNKAA